MKKSINLLSIIFALVLLSSCNANKKVIATLDTWKGHGKVELLSVWGAPSQITDNGAGGEILVFVSSRNDGQTPGYSFTNQYGLTTYIPPRTSMTNQQTLFYLNADKIIYQWKCTVNGRDIK